MACGVDLLATKKTSTMGPPRKSLLERMGDKIQISDGCWEWTGLINAEGYGTIPRGGGQYSGTRFNLLAHRLVYELLVGPIPEGLQLDHLCRVRNCVNPAHLEPVTQRENTMRSPIAPAAINARKTHCPRGHPYDVVRYPLNRSPERGCRRCARAATAAYRLRKAQNGI